jgi:Ca-activated chloride channel family protein
VPLTRDRESFRRMLDAVDPLTVGRGGTDLGVALTTAVDALEGAAGDHEVVLLLTDGEDHEGRGARVAETLRDRGVTVHAVGFGSPRGAKIAVGGPDGETYLRDRAGRDVVTAMDRTGLRRIADRTGGTFVEAGGEDALVDLWRDRIAPIAGKRHDEERRRERENRFSWLLLPAFLLLLVRLGRGR